MFQIWLPGSVTLPWIALLASSVSIELVSSSARNNSVKFQVSLFNNRDTRDLRYAWDPGPGSDNYRPMVGFIDHCGHPGCVMY